MIDVISRTRILRAKAYFQVFFSGCSNDGLMGTVGALPDRNSAVVQCSLAKGLGVEMG